MSTYLDPWRRVRLGLQRRLGNIGYRGQKRVGENQVGMPCVELSAVEKQSWESWSTRKVGLATQLLPCVPRVCCLSSKAGSSHYELPHEVVEIALLWYINAAGGGHGGRDTLQLTYSFWCEMLGKGPIPLRPKYLLQCGWNAGKWRPGKTSGFISVGLTWGR